MDPIVYIAVGVAQIVAILGGGGVVAFRIGRSTQRVESSIELQKIAIAQSAGAISDIKADIAALKAVLTEVALQKAEIKQLREWYDELRRGEGFVYPLGSHLRSAPG